MQKKFSFFGSRDLFFAHMLVIMLALDHGLLGLMWSTLMKVSFATPPCPQVSLSLSLKNTHAHTDELLLAHTKSPSILTHWFLHQRMVTIESNWVTKCVALQLGWFTWDAEKACLKGLCWCAMIISHLGGSSLKEFHVLFKKKRKEKKLHGNIAFSKSLAWRRNFFLCVCGENRTTILLPLVIPATLVWDNSLAEEAS